MTSALPTRSAARAASSPTSSGFCPAARRASATAAAPDPSATAARGGWGGRLRKATPSASESRSGNPKVQKTAEGSRKTSRSRAAVSCPSEDRSERSPLVTQPPAGQGHEDVLERGAVGDEALERRPHLLEVLEQRRHGQVDAVDR